MSNIFGSRKSDIENERLPPELMDPDEVAPHLSSPATPSEEGTGSPSPNGIKAAIEAAITNGSIAPTAARTPAATSATTSSQPISPATPTSGSAGSGSMVSPFRRGHARQASLGTTMTSPSTRRRSMESTISLIKEAVDGKQDTNELTNLADQLSSPTREKRDLPLGKPAVP